MLENDDVVNRHLGLEIEGATETVGDLVSELGGDFVEDDLDRDCCGRQDQADGYRADEQPYRRFVEFVGHAFTIPYVLTLPVYRR